MAFDANAKVLWSRRDDRGFPDRCFNFAPMARPRGAGTIGAPFLPHASMANRRDKPPILRVLILLVALVSTALALAALSPSQADPASSGAGTTTSVQVAPPAPAARHP